MLGWTARHLASVLLSCVLLGAPTAGATSFTPEQRAEIIGILREALRSDPSILREALEALRSPVTHRATSRWSPLSLLLPTLAELLKAEPGIRLVYKDLPVLGPTSQIETRALLAAHRQGG
jgi:hypothetical protein